MRGLHRGRSWPKPLIPDKRAQAGRVIRLCRAHGTCMKIEKDRVVQVHYTLFEGGAPAPGQEPLERSRERAPLAILAGRGYIIPGLDNALEGREAG